MRIAVSASQGLFVSPSSRSKRERIVLINMAVNKTAHPFNKQQLESVLTQRFFCAPAGGDRL